MAKEEAPKKSKTELIDDACGGCNTFPDDRMSVYLKDFDLAGGRVEVLSVLSTVSLGERVELDPEGDALLAAVLPRSELCADAVHLQTAGHESTAES